MIVNEHIFDEKSFIGGWYISEKICDDLLNYFFINSDFLKKGTIGTDKGAVVDNSYKDSYDLAVEVKNFQNPLIKNYIKTLCDICNLYEKKYPYSKNNDSYGFNTDFNLQYYPPKGGFKQWHHERGSSLVSTRLFVFMTYLNTVPDGGTCFVHQNITTLAKKGLTLIWPCEWTHTHRGQISEKDEKYIATGWLNFI
jgi:hypothetical protein